MVRKPLCFLLFLLTSGCEIDPRAVIYHPDVDTRVRQSLDTIILPPATLPSTFRFAVFGDLHIGKPAGAYWQRFVKLIDSLEIAFFCVAGDLTDHGSAQEYDSVLSLFQGTTKPYFVTIGNHDLYRVQSWNFYWTHFGPSCYALTPSPELKLIFLDTGEGRLGGVQFDWLKSQLQCPHKYQLIITHFPIYDDQTPSIFRLASVGERSKLLGLLRDYRVYAICSGHIHGFRHYMIDGTNHLTIGTISRALDFGLPGFVLFEVKPDTISWSFIPLAE